MYIISYSFKENIRKAGSFLRPAVAGRTVAGCGPGSPQLQPRSLQLENEESNVVKRYYIRCKTKKRKREWNIYLRD
ncbi:hypothetical protein DW980_06725 [Bacteroides stercoris]|nr:hypothetical protein DW980_06725 [Bacteroides stercoris]